MEAPQGSTRAVTRDCLVCFSFFLKKHRIWERYKLKAETKVFKAVQKRFATEKKNRTDAGT
jgi:hypothetical protein